MNTQRMRVMSSGTCESHIGEDVPITIEFDYTPEQKLILNPPDNAQEGIPEDIEITGVLVNNKYISEALKAKWLDKLKEAVWEYIEKCRDE
jgi:hypothetical protein